MKKLLRKLTSWYFKKEILSFWVILLIDSLLVIVSGITAYILYNGFVTDIYDFLHLLLTICCYWVFYLVGFRIMHTYSGVIRYSSFVDLYRIVVANIIGGSLVWIVRHISLVDTYLTPISYETIFITFLLATSTMWMLRLVVKYMYDIYYIDVNAQKVFIYGVKEGGIALAKSIHTQNSRYIVAGFVSDECKDYHHELMGAKIFPNDDGLISTMVSNEVSVLMVSPYKTEAFRNNQKMVDAMVNANIKIMIYSQQEWDGKSDLNHSMLKEVDIEDLLPRHQIQVDLDAISNVLKDKCVLITGAAGSIGSEMVLQVASFNPSQLVLIDQAETPLHDIRLMMEREFRHIPCETITMSICQKFHIDKIFAKYRPEYVFHAAAYKHVPMMEDNPVEAVMNNILGTQVIADISVKYGVKKFVMISTDKAVNPTNVMGCSKRICEMYCQSLNKSIKDGETKGSTEFITTRFGNVLGSNGSVIPIFKEQIKNGGPITVTHPDIIRFFMLISEACRLVLQAGTMGHGGEIFVFDMGSAVKIVDLAKRMIYLSGASDVKIVYSGLRDGEKLYEELLSIEENTLPSSHPKIRLAKVRELGYNDVRAQIEELYAITTSKVDDMSIVRQMKAIVPEFKSKHSKWEVLDEQS